MNSRRFYLLLSTLVLLGWLAAPRAWAQGKRRVVQFTGIVASGDSLLGVPGATVVVPKAGRGTSTNAYGYFSMPVLTGDSIVFRSLGYHNQTIVISEDYQRQSYSVIITLREDPAILPEVRVFPYATEIEFKRAFLALRLPNEKGTSAAENLNAQLMQRILNSMPVGATANFRQSMSQQQLDFDRRMGTAPNLQSNNPLLNPFSWLQLIKQIKNGDFKKKDRDEF
ncbi:MAG: carboxypeptidase-like regulatory domain-containing protein [Janthinobacterium lividum]